MTYAKANTFTFTHSARLYGQNAALHSAPPANRRDSRRRAAGPSGARRARLHRRALQTSIALFPLYRYSITHPLRILILRCFFYVSVFYYFLFAQTPRYTYGTPFTIKVNDV